MITDFDTDEAYLTRMRGVGAGLVENGQQDANANFIAAAPTIVRSLLDQNAELQLKLFAMKQWQLDVEEREAAVCPEDVGFDEHIKFLQRELVEARAEKEAANRLAEHAMKDRLKFKEQFELLDDPQGLYTETRNAVRAEERERCAKDVCMYCGGCCPTHETQVEGPNSAGNYTHRPRSGYAVGGGGPRLCNATSLWSRHRYEIAEAASKSAEKE